MGFTLEETQELRKLCNLESECLQEVDSSTSLPSSSNEEEYLSSDSLYLKHLLSKLLTRAIREVITRKPSDPVEYLGHWLLNYKVEYFEPSIVPKFSTTLSEEIDQLKFQICEEREKRRKEFELELMIERERVKLQVNATCNLILPFFYGK
ncbi:hypothetical protein K0M31_019593 [Melipona bicolor]|uniref:DPY30 domain-containing protein 2 n=1 Tax=Melipona bicolor TaxID=60889 RepID=A0AA40G3L1_9HYME|nr:hypothetical protein K0M31_019593 [Melipona bicolor]